MNTKELWAQIERSVDSGELFEHIEDIVPPEDLYLHGQLHDWAREEGPLEVFDLSDLVDEVVCHCTPQEVFGYDVFEDHVQNEITNLSPEELYGEEYMEEWIRQEVELTNPEDYYSEEQLENWAERNGYKKDD